MFNKYNWELYVKTDGRETIKCFDDFIQGNDLKSAVDKLVELHNAYCPDISLTDTLQYELNVGITAITEDVTDNKDWNNSNKIYDLEKYSQISNHIDTFAQEEWEREFRFYENTILNDKDAFSDFSNCITPWSLIISYCNPECFVPYCYFGLYNVFKEICEEFDISLPEPPAKTDYKGRYFHYAEICKALQKFRQEHDLTSAELWAFLYEYGNNVIGLRKWLSNGVGQPRRAFFIGANKDSNGDSSFLEKALNGQHTAIRWQANPDAEINDIHVMYVLSPVSTIQYTLQAVSNGFVDPFFYYYRSIFLGNLTKVPDISLKDLKNDEDLGSIPLVKANMQGVNGREIKALDYEKLINHFLKLGMNKEKIIHLKEYTLENAIVTNEKAVEEKLIKPFLHQLGYSQSDYKSYITVKMGRNEKIIPDIVVMLNNTSGKETAEFIIEAKYLIRTKKELKKALDQARSYARRLLANAIIIADREAVWMYRKNDDYTKSETYTWNDLKLKDNMNILYNTIGKSALRLK